MWMVQELKGVGPFRTGPPLFVRTCVRTGEQCREARGGLRTSRRM